MLIIAFIVGKGFILKKDTPRLVYLIKNTVIIAYAVLNDLVCSFVITHNKIRIHQTGLNKWDIRILVDSFRFECQDLLPMYSLTKLRNELLSPVEPWIQEAKALIFVPPADLFGVAHHAPGRRTTSVVG